MNKANAEATKHWDQVKKEQKEHMKALKDYYKELILKGCNPCEKRFDCEILNASRECKENGFTHGAVANLVNCKDLRARLLNDF